MKNIVIFILAVGFILMTLVAVKPSIKRCGSYGGEVLRNIGGTLYCTINIEEEDSPL